MSDYVYMTFISVVQYITFWAHTNLLLSILACCFINMQVASSKTSALN